MNSVHFIWDNAKCHAVNKISLPIENANVLKIFILSNSSDNSYTQNMNCGRDHEITLPSVGCLAITHNVFMYDLINF